MSSVKSIVSALGLLPAGQIGASLSAMSPPLRSAVLGELARQRRAKLNGLVGATGFSEIVGAPAPARAGFVLRQAPTGGVYTSLHVGAVRMGDHATSIANARTAGQRAVQVADRIDASIQRLPSKGSMKVSAALKRASTATRKAGKDALAQADKHSAVVSAARNKLALGTQQLKQRMAQSTTFVHGVRDIDVLGATVEWEIVGAYAPNPMDPPNPSMPGYLMSGAPDPGYQPNPAQPGYLMNGQLASAYGATTTPGAIDPTTGLPVASSSTDPTGEVAALGPPPTMASVQAAYAASGPQTDPVPSFNDQADYSGIAHTNCTANRGIIVNDGQHGNNVNAFGNWRHFFGDGDGYFFGSQGGGSWRKYIHKGHDNNPAEKKYQGAGPGMLQQIAADTKSLNGPLIGNPKTPNDASWANGLRFDPVNGTFFWFWDTAARVAPWAMQSVYQQLLSQAMTDYQAKLATANTDNANAVAQNLLNTQQATQMQKQNALADNQTQHDMDTQAAQQQAQQGQLAHQHQHADIQAQQAAPQYGSSASALDLQQRQQ